MEEAVAQDPGAALRAWPGSGLLAPGSTGLALAAGGPDGDGGRAGALPGRQSRPCAREPGRDPPGARARGRRVTSSGVWMRRAACPIPPCCCRRRTVNQGVPLYQGVPPAGIVVQWERLPQAAGVSGGRPLPAATDGCAPRGVRAHGQAHCRPAFPSISPSGKTSGNVALRFAEGGIGGCAVRGRTRAEIGGRWWWSRGHLHVALDGTAQATAWPWRGLAALRPEGRLNVDSDAAGARGGCGVSGR